MEEDIFESLRDDIPNDAYTFTPQFDSFKIQASPLNINEKIKDLEKNGYMIDENDFRYIEKFLISPFFEENRKEELKKHLDENYNKYLFDRVFSNIQTVPIRLNGMPYKEDGEIICIPSEEIKDFLRNGTIPESRKNDVMFYSTIIDFCNNPYFISEFCYEKIKPQLTYIEQIKSNIMKQREIISEQKDKETLNTMNKRFHEQPKKEIHVNDNLKQQILSKIPENFSQLEKSIWIYLKLCDYFSYDPKFFASQNKHLLEHDSISNIEKLSQANNNIVCYEFTYALSDILTDIGIKCIDNISYDIDEQEDGRFVPATFRNQHSNLKYIVDDTIIFADSTNSVKQGDISEWKYSNRPTGIRCNNYSLNNRKKFNDAMSNVMDYMNQYENRFHIKDIEEEYDKLCSRSYLDMHDKMVFMYEKIVQFPYDELDLISYVNRLKKIIFSKRELQENFRVIPIKNADDEMDLLFSINKSSFGYSPYNTQYYLLNIKTKQMKKQQLEDIIKKFEDKIVSTVEKEDIIPALKINSTYLKKQAEEMIKAMEKNYLDIDGNPMNQQQETDNPFIENGQKNSASSKMGL